MFVLKAISSWDVEAEQNVVEVTIDRWRPGTGWQKHTDFLYTKANGNWTEIKFHRSECVKYEKFLDSMVEKNLEVCRKIAHVKTTLVIDSGRFSDMRKVVDAVSVLDPTFTPPIINLKCRWQRELLESLCNEWTRMVISTCYNCVRLGNYSRELDSFFIS